ncbi:MAG: N-acetyl-gamma-glutamyl-phosphate reductase [Ignavibacteria bacterium]|nr:N-acetyl-gamma-glutamyl-phosphate reductase [Ignavibacteria bacterium]
MSNTVNAGILGGAGYTGGEAIRLLLNHSNVNLSFVHSRSHAGSPLHSVHEDLVGETDLHFSDALDDTVDVMFLCLGSGESKHFLNENSISDNVKIIDLSHDFRLAESSDSRIFVYGLPELNREEIRRANNIANPGCFATGILLGLLPLANSGILGEVYSTGITGSTGAGRKFDNSTHFAWRANNISAYKTLTHQHLDEINNSLKQLQPGFRNSINFVPWRGGFTRGVFVSSTFTSDRSLAEMIKLYKEYYFYHPFTVVSDETINLKQVVNTSRCMVNLAKEGEKFVVHTAIDNLLKGASGQAVQNMNLMFGLEETTGLRLKSIVY